MRIFYSQDFDLATIAPPRHHSSDVHPVCETARAVSGREEVLSAMLDACLARAPRCPAKAGSQVGPPGLPTGVQGQPFRRSYGKTADHLPVVPDSKSSANSRGSKTASRPAFKLVLALVRLQMSSER